MMSASIHSEKTASFMPREHGATAMLLTPFFAAVILLRHAYWLEFIVLAAAVGTLMLKDPLVVIARQQLVWKQAHAETARARRTAAALGTLLFGCGILLALVRDWRPWIPLVAGGSAFTALAVVVNVRNRQRSEWFQAASAAALSATCLAACLAAIGQIPGWCWLLWIVSTLHAVAGIFVVHARLDARIALRKQTPPSRRIRRVAYFAQGVVCAAAIPFATLGRYWVTAALILTATAYLVELRRQRDPASLQMSLRSVGLRALAQSIVYTLMIIAGLWR